MCYGPASHGTSESDRHWQSNRLGFTRGKKEIRPSFSPQDKHLDIILRKQLLCCDIGPYLKILAAHVSDWVPVSSTLWELLVKTSLTKNMGSSLNYQKRLKMNFLKVWFYYFDTCLVTSFLSIMCLIFLVVWNLLLGRMVLKLPSRSQEQRRIWSCLVKSQNQQSVLAPLVRFISWSAPLFSTPTRRSISERSLHVRTSSCGKTSRSPKMEGND